MFLALGAGVVGLFYLLDQSYSRFIEQPTALLGTQLAAAQRSLGDAKAEQISGRKLANQLEGYAERALPHDPALARAVYQKWLLELVQRHRMDRRRSMPKRLRRSKCGDGSTAGSGGWWATPFGMGCERGRRCST